MRPKLDASPAIWPAWPLSCGVGLVRLFRVRAMRKKDMPAQFGRRTPRQRVDVSKSMRTWPVWPPDIIAKGLKWATLRRHSRLAGGQTGHSDNTSMSSNRPEPELVSMRGQPQRASHCSSFAGIAMMASSLSRHFLGTWERLSTLKAPSARHFWLIVARRLFSSLALSLHSFLHCATSANTGAVGVAVRAAAIMTAQRTFLSISE